MKRSLVEVNRA